MRGLRRIGLGLAGMCGVLALWQWGGNTASAPPPPRPTSTAVVLGVPRAAMLPSATPAPTLTPTWVAPNLPPIVHVVQPGETLPGIAYAYGVSTVGLAAANGMVSASAVAPGQQLTIPLNTAVSRPPGAPTPPPATPVPPTPTPTPLYPALPQTLNGLPLAVLVVAPPDVLRHMRQVYARGQRLGNNPHAFSKLGDSTIENPFFMARFDEGGYNLGAWASLQPAIDAFQGSHARQGVAVRRGLHSWSVFDPLWADPAQCQPNETMILCEFRLHRPSVLFVRLGSNDAGTPERFEQFLGRIVETSLAHGVIPVLGTKADRFEGSNSGNLAIRRVAAAYNVPLWEWDLAAQTIPGRGLGPDGVHLTTWYSHDYTQPEAFRRGYSVHNLSALLMLDVLWRHAMMPVDPQWGSGPVPATRLD